MLSIGGAQTQGSSEFSRSPVLCLPAPLVGQEGCRHTSEIITCTTLQHKSLYSFESHSRPFRNIYRNPECFSVLDVKSNVASVLEDHFIPVVVWMEPHTCSECTKCARLSPHGCKTWIGFSGQMLQVTGSVCRFYRETKKLLSALSKVYFSQPID